MDAQLIHLAFYIQSPTVCSYTFRELNTPLHNKTATDF